jgi:hypothetical protein
MIVLSLPPNPHLTLDHTNLSPTTFTGANAATVIILANCRKPLGVPTSPTAHPRANFPCPAGMLPVTVKSLLNILTGTLPLANLSCTLAAIFSKTRGTNTNHFGWCLAMSLRKVRIVEYTTEQLRESIQISKDRSVMCHTGNNDTMASPGKGSVSS